MTDRMVLGVLRREGKLLLCHRQPARAIYPDVWDLPGGHIDEGEETSQALVRELEEELGVRVDADLVMRWKTIHLDGDELNLFIVDRWEGEPANTAPEEHDEIGWFLPDEAETLHLAHSSYPQMLRDAARA